MGLEEQANQAKEIVDSDPKGAEQQLRKIVFDVPGTDVETVRVKEQAIGSLSDVYVKLQDAKSLADLLSQLREFFGAIPKAKTAKIVRGIIDQIAKIPDSTQLQVRVGTERVWRRRRAACVLQLACARTLVCKVGAETLVWCRPPTPTRRNFSLCI